MAAPAFSVLLLLVFFPNCLPMPSAVAGWVPSGVTCLNCHFTVESKTALHCTNTQKTPQTCPERRRYGGQKNGRVSFFKKGGKIRPKSSFIERGGFLNFDESIQTPSLTLLLVISFFPGGCFWCCNLVHGGSGRASGDDSLDAIRTAQTASTTALPLSHATSLSVGESSSQQPQRRFSRRRNSGSTSPPSSTNGRVVHFASAYLIAQVSFSGSFLTF